MSAPAANGKAYPLKVLMITGDRTPFRRLTFAMEQQGYEIAFAADLYQGLILVDETGPDMVILDAAVAGSLRLCAHIRKLVHIPIILMGSDPPSKAWEQAVDEGADAYVSTFTDAVEVVATAGSIVRRYRTSLGQDPH